MPFPEAVRRWAKRIADNKCQTLVYSERGGWKTCGKTADLHVDHLDPEGFVLTNGGDPNNDSIPFVRCKEHHVGAGLVRDNGSVRVAHYGERQWSRHADVGIARMRYRQGDKEAISKAIDVHRQKTREGVKYWNSDDGVDESERQQSLDLIHRAALNGDVRPKVKTHKNTQRRKKWYDGLF